jgi:hypothetical protein
MLPAIVNYLQLKTHTRMLQTKRRDGAIVTSAENDYDRKVLRQRAGTPSKGYKHLMNPPGIYNTYKLNHSRNRKATNGRTFKMVEIKENVVGKQAKGVTLLASKILRSTGRFKKFIIKKFYIGGK